MLHYFDPIFMDDVVVSIDNIVLDVSITQPDRRDLLDIQLEMMSRCNKVEVTSWTSTKPGTFREQSTIRFDAERAFWLGRGLNGQGVLEDRCRLDFNPNKVAYEPNFRSVHAFMLRNTRSCLTRIPRFDLAIDIPIRRDHCFLVKDRRMYIERRHGKFDRLIGLICAIEDWQINLGDILAVSHFGEDMARLLWPTYWEAIVEELFVFVYSCYKKFASEVRVSHEYSDEDLVIMREEIMNNWVFKIVFGWYQSEIYDFSTGFRKMLFDILLGAH